MENDGFGRCCGCAGDLMLGLSVQVDFETIIMMVPGPLFVDLRRKQRLNFAAAFFIVHLHVHNEPALSGTRISSMRLMRCLASAFSI